MRCVVAIHSGADLSNTSMLDKLQNVRVSDRSNDFLHQAVEKGNVDVIEYLILCGCNPEGRNKDDITGLDVALISQDQGLIDYLLSTLNHHTN